MSNPKSNSPWHPRNRISSGSIDPAIFEGLESLGDKTFEITDDVIKTGEREIARAAELLLTTYNTVSPNKFHDKSEIWTALQKFLKDVQQDFSEGLQAQNINEAAITIEQEKVGVIVPMQSSPAFVALVELKTDKGRYVVISEDGELQISNNPASIFVQGRVDGPVSIYSLHPIYSNTAYKELLEKPGLGPDQKIKLTNAVTAYINDLHKDGLLTDSEHSSIDVPRLVRNARRASDTHVIIPLLNGWHQFKFSLTSSSTLRCQFVQQVEH